MKYLYQFMLIAACVAIFGFAGANSLTENDSVQMGEGYANDIYYSMENGEVHAVNRTNWDIGFYANAMSAGIITNEGNGIELRVYPHADTEGWDNIDTTGLSTWPVLYNSPENWEDGAFNRNALGHPDYGWGVYNTITHNVVGDSIYIVSFAEGPPMKLWIKQKLSSDNTYEIMYASYDGMAEVSASINCTDYSEKNFVYYSLQTNEVLDRDPDPASWDILFTKYNVMLPGGVPYIVTGVLNNINVPANRFDEIGPEFMNWFEQALDSTKTPISYDWKYFDMSQFSYVVEDSIAFFVSTRSKDVYKLVFSVFDYTVGNIVFDKSMVSLASVSNIEKNEEFKIFPNPARNVISVQNIADSKIDRITISDLSGRVVFTSLFSSKDEKLNVSHLNDGLYIMSIHSGEEVYSEKIIIQHD